MNRIVVMNHVTLGRVMQGAVARAGVVIASCEPVRG